MVRSRRSGRSGWGRPSPPAAGRRSPCWASTNRPGTRSALLDSLRRAQALLEDKKVHAELITKSGRVVEEIRKRTEEAKYDLVVIGAVRKETRGAFWMSSKSYKIIKGIQPPVLTVAGKCASLERILICSGGRRYIDPAVRLTGEIARCTGAQVTLLHVMPEPPAIYAPLAGMEEPAGRLLNSTIGTRLEPAP